MIYKGNLGFIRKFLATYPEEVTVEKLLISAEKLKELFFETIEQNNILTIDEELIPLLNYIEKRNTS
ncbi:hypothetical protein ERL59_04140 [Chengkuizengella sp. YPA3-1-1]|uniref:Uncharacterized protein n=1 Tax=Chengkuizengella marina TaxID=2507566 RepID=A0A6N9PYV7_9BACL|nr:hypothetical protein [Chengkuizengella marina]